MLTGKLLSGFATGRKRMVTTTAAIGIPGTGLYVEADPENAYICTC